MSNVVGRMRFFLWLSPLAAAAGFGRANAQAKLDATYGVTVLGLPIGEITWRVDLRDNWFSMEANGATSTLLQIVSRGRGNVIAHGPLVAGKPTASNFALKLDAGRWSDDLEIVFSGGKAREIFRIPSPAPNANIVPLTDAHRVGVVDPMTALLVFIPGNGDVAVPEACARTVAIFDGHTRYNLRLGFKRVDKVNAAKGYEGPVVICSVEFIPLAGYDPNRFMVTYLSAQRDMEVWLAPLAGTRLLLPYRVSLLTPLGLGVLQATKFEALPAHSLATSLH